MSPNCCILLQILIFEKLFKSRKIHENSRIFEKIGIFSTLKMRPITEISHKNDIRMLLKVGKFVGIQPKYEQAVPFTTFVSTILQMANCKCFKFSNEISPSHPEHTVFVISSLQQIINIFYRDLRTVSGLHERSESDQISSRILIFVFVRRPKSGPRFSSRSVPVRGSQA